MLFIFKIVSTSYWSFFFIGAFFNFSSEQVLVLITHVCSLSIALLYIERLADNTKIDQNWAQYEKGKSKKQKSRNNVNNFVFSIKQTDITSKT